MTIMMNKLKLHPAAWIDLKHNAEWKKPDPKEYVL